MAKRVALTTVDNPFDPLTQFENWYAFDTQHGYNSTALLGRVVVTSHELSEADQEAAVEAAVDEIVRENVLGIYKKVTLEE